MRPSGRRTWSRGRSLGSSTRACSTCPDRKSTRLNSSHSQISYAVFCLKKKKHHAHPALRETNKTRWCDRLITCLDLYEDVCGLSGPRIPSRLRCHSSARRSYSVLPTVL